MSGPLRIVWAAFAAVLGAVLVGSLALVSIVPTWGLLCFYGPPSLFLAAWAARELAPGWWRTIATPARRRWRQSCFAASPARAAPAAAPGGRAATGRRSVVTPLAALARAWLRTLRPVLTALRSPRGRRIRDASVVLASAVVVALVVRTLVARGWPAPRLDALATAAACAFFVSMFGLRALGWQRLFQSRERPRSLALVTGNGTAEIVSLALPPRVGDAVCISVVRSFTRRAPSIGTTALSLFVLGLMDIAAIVPLAIYALVAVHAGASVRIALLFILGVGVGAAALAAALPSIRNSARLTSRGLGHWLALHVPTSRRESLWSWCLVCASWLARAAALLLLLDALGLRTTFALACAYTVADAGASSLPFGPAGAATEAGAGAAILAGSGISPDHAVALAVTAQGLTAGTGGVLALLGAGLLRRRHRRLGRR